MRRIFTLENPEFDIPSVHHLEMEWEGAAHRDLARQIAFQDQFRQLYQHVFLNLESVPASSPSLRAIPLALSARAGAIKTYVLLSVSIAEGALAALGEERGLGRQDGELFKKPFGGLLAVWEENGRPRPEVAEIWEDLQILKRYRNYVHLNRAAQDQAEWQEIIANERQILDAAEHVVNELRSLCHVFRET